MSMDGVFETLFSLPTVVMCLGVYLLTFIIRTVVENYWEGSKTSKFWNHIFLPLGAIGSGMILGFCSKAFPWPAAISASVIGRVFYGGICGVFSGFIFGRVKAFLNDNTKDEMCGDRHEEHREEDHKNDGK